MCKHDQSMLVGSAAGITCRACGKTFPTWAAMMAEKSPPPEREAPVAVTEAQEALAKSKRGRPKKTAQE